MQIILIFIRHYLLCLIGTFFRYLFKNIINIIKNNPENELKYAFVGFLFLGIILLILI
ncbi:hypothetical protein Q361_1531 [Flavobacterium croceum DSM 17960]|uniref:Uncharacterized protein n=1 Tax=Flavobacterium croceum DSM 17960 TaxID=1121886 RepID=A0A2S4N4H3_9FLAO|nr:hypothetical protein Q361_1531 [Flavobacterium croceum DSM 17960]